MYVGLVSQDNNALVVSVTTHGVKETIGNNVNCS